MYYCCSVMAGNIICFARVCVCCLLCYLVCLYERVCVKLLCIQILFSQSALMPVSRWVTHQTIEDPRQGTDNTIIKKSFSFFFSEKDGIPSKLKNIAKGTTDPDYESVHSIKNSCEYCNLKVLSENTLKCKKNIPIRPEQRQAIL